MRYPERKRTPERREHVARLAELERRGGDEVLATYAAAVLAIGAEGPRLRLSRAFVAALDRRRP